MQLSPLTFHPVNQLNEFIGNNYYAQLKFVLYQFLLLIQQGTSLSLEGRRVRGQIAIGE